MVSRLHCLCARMHAETWRKGYSVVEQSCSPQEPESWCSLASSCFWCIWAYTSWVVPPTVRAALPLQFAVPRASGLSEYSHMQPKKGLYSFLRSFSTLIKLTVKIKPSYWLDKSFLKLPFKQVVLLLSPFPYPFTGKLTSQSNESLCTFHFQETRTEL